MKENTFIINNQKLEIGRIELDKDTLAVYEKGKNYQLNIIISYDWKAINNLNVGEEGNWMYNEYILIEKEEPALVWPTKYLTKKITKDILYFELKFEDLNNEKNICYMNKRGYFDNQLYNMEVKIYIDYRDAKNGKIIYEF